MTTPRAKTVARSNESCSICTAIRRSARSPRCSSSRGGAFYSEAAVELVAALLADTGDIQVVDVRNGAALSGLAEDDVVEVPARVGKTGVGAGGAAPLAPEFLGLVQHVTAYERLAASAAATGDRDAARLALLAHPLVRE